MEQSRSEAIRTQELPGFPRVHQGKVRDIFDLGEHLLMVATDRISAFDVVLPNAIPNKGAVLTQLSAFWFARLEGMVPHHLVSVRMDDLPASLAPYRQQLAGRSMLVQKCQPLAIECVVRGYLDGSGWKEYRRTGKVCGIQLPAELRQCEELPQPIFTPSTKAQQGHDENIDFAGAVEIVGEDVANRVRELSLKIYESARSFARERGIIIGDTKFEFGLAGDRLLLIDEVLTPDSSRFWPSDQYQPGRSQPSFDKQFIRDYLETLGWDKSPPGPELPGEVVQATAERYLEAYRLLTGEVLNVEG